MNSAEKALWSHIAARDYASAKDVLIKSTVNVNWANKEHQENTLLHLAVQEDADEITKLLLVHPGLDVHKGNSTGRTAFLSACYLGKVAAVRHFLKLGWLNVNQCERDGSTALWDACYNGHLAVVEWLIAAREDLDLEKTGDPGTDDHQEYKPLEIAKMNGKRDVVDLMIKIMSDPVTTRQMLRMKLGIREQGNSPHPPPPLQPPLSVA